MKNIAAGIALLATSAVSAEAMEIHFTGYADARLTAMSDQKSWLEGGLGKLRYGKGDSTLQFAGAVGQATVLFTGEWSAVGVVRVAPDQRNFAELLEGYVRYRPVSTTRWRWSAKAGAFFPEISLENPETGWASYWTVTPSAINSWVGAELRTIGGEGKIEWRGDEDNLSLAGAMFGWNDPAGVLLADRGWTLDDRYTGLTDHPRLPDISVARTGGVPPGYTPMFEEIDKRPGWYAVADWDSRELGKFNLVRYNNQADPAAKTDVFAWRTTFWDAGVSETFGPFTLLAQGMTGSTMIAPRANFSSTTDFDSAYALLGWEEEGWRLSGRAEYFHTHNYTTTNGTLIALGPYSENGYAFTGAASWLPTDWSRLTAELIYLDSTRDERSLGGIAPGEAETQFQLSAKIYY